MVHFILKLASIFSVCPTPRTLTSSSSSSPSSSSGSSVASSVDVAVTVDPSRMTDVGDANSDRDVDKVFFFPGEATVGTLLGAASFDDEAWGGWAGLMPSLI